MFSCRRGKVWLAAAAVLVAVPALAHGQGSPPASASYTASDSATASRDTFRWYLIGTTQTDVTIVTGATVSFSNPASAVRAHNVDFTDAVKPQCQLSTSDTRCSCPIPSSPARNWSGTSTFAEPGTYLFLCDLHPAMTGTITVSAPPETTATATATPVPTPSPPPLPPRSPPRPPPRSPPRPPRRRRLRRPARRRSR